MRKDLKTRSQIGSAIDNVLLNPLRAYSKESSVPISKLLDRAIKMYLGGWDISISFFAYDKSPY